jgi:uncharacterized protein YraI
MVSSMKKWLFALTFCLAAGLSSAHAQVRITATPVPAVIPTLTTLPTELALASATPTLTVTPEAAIQIEVRSDVGDVNVRQEPDPESPRLGTIKAGQKFGVVARYFRWIQFDFPDAPSGRGWVFEDLVTIIGDAAAIPNIDPYSEPSATPDAAQAAFAETLAAVTLTPGADLTLLAQQRIVTIPALSGTGTATQDTGPLPTFTPPAEMIPLNSGNSSGAVNPANIGVIEEALAQVTSGNIPPMVPIVLLTLGGLLGMLVSSLRR